MPQTMLELSSFGILPSNGKVARLYRPYVPLSSPPYTPARRRRRYSYRYPFVFTTTVPNLLITSTPNGRLNIQEDLTATSVLRPSGSQYSRYH
jgi:hypothetical protein